MNTYEICIKIGFYAATKLSQLTGCDVTTAMKIFDQVAVLKDDTIVMNTLEKIVEIVHKHTTPIFSNEVVRQTCDYVRRSYGTLTSI